MMRHAAISLFCLALAGCEEGPTQANTPAEVSTVQVSSAVDTATALGSALQFTAFAKDAAGNVLTGKSVMWSSTVPAVAVVNPTTGVATTAANGSTSIRAVVDGVTGARTLTVVQDVATVTVSPATFTINAGASQQFTATARDANGNAVPGIKFLWVSSNANVAVVDTTGLARGVGRGDAIITAAARGQPGNAVLSVAALAAPAACAAQS